MTPRWRAVARIAAFGAVAVLLGACMKLDMDLEVSAEDTVSGTVIFAFDKDLLELAGQSAEDLLGTDAPVPTDAPGVSTEAYEDGEFEGTEIRFDGVPLERFNQGEGPDQLRIVREGDVFLVSGTLDLSGGTGATGLTGLGEGLGEAFEGAELRIRITFPGEVTDSNGQIDGNSVTWVPVIGERLEVRATASAIDTGGGSSLPLILIVAGVIVVAAIVVAVVLSRRRGPGAPAPAEAVAGVEGAPAAPAPPEEPGGIAPPPPPEEPGGIAPPPPPQG